MTAVGLSTAGVFGWLAVRKVDWPAAGTALASANWRLLGLCVPLLSSSVLWRALRWRVVLAQQGAARIGPLALAAGIGQGANAILPGKLGEAVGAHALGRLADLSRIQSLGIMVVTRLTDAVILFALVLGATWFLPSPALRALRGASLIAVATATLALLLPVVLRRQWGVRCLNYAADILQRRLGTGALEVMRKFGRGLTTAGRAPLLLAFLASTALMWGVLSLSLLIALRAFSIELPAGYAPLIMGLIAASTILPAAPGNIGTVHYFGLVALGLVGVAPGLAGACIIAYHALDLVCALVIGAICWTIAGGRLSLWRKPELDVLARASAPVDGLTFGAAALELTTPEQSQPQQHHSTTTLLAAEEA